ncbi:MAG: hypothetical protein ACUVQ0_06370 [Thermoproteota archaeon]
MKIVRKIRVALEILITFLVMIPTFLYLLISYYSIKRGIRKSRSKFVKILMKEGIPESSSLKIAEYFFPEIAFSIFRIFTSGGWRAVGKPNR